MDFFHKVIRDWYKNLPLRLMSARNCSCEQILFLKYSVCICVPPLPITSEAEYPLPRPKSSPLLSLIMITGEQNKKKKCCLEYFTWFHSIRSHRCLNENDRLDPKVSMQKSVWKTDHPGPRYLRKTKMGLRFGLVGHV